jgi:PASTA domain
MRRFLAALVLLAAMTGCSAVSQLGPAPAQPSPNSVLSSVPGLIAMPNLVGENAAVAEDRLRKLGFTDITFGTLDGRMAVVLPQNWTVRAQSTAPDERIAADTKIVLGCTRNG